LAVLEENTPVTTRELHCSHWWALSDKYWSSSTTTACYFEWC